MKKTVVCVALWVLTAPIAYSLGLGSLTVQSALDQPFIAEIELIDSSRVQLKDVKVSVAAPEYFTQIGLERTAVLSLLTLSIAKNEQGKEVIKVRSSERMIEPYMELVVDLTWPRGQLYKAYTILLDPPGYRLISTTIKGHSTHYIRHKPYVGEPGVINKTVLTGITRNSNSLSEDKRQSTYGPTMANENVWQIAQRYKTADVVLPQVVLAIVGSNPHAFKDGNLNGLKAGVQLIIPSTIDIKKVPAELATAEAMTHDKAWNEDVFIDHVLSPPYHTAQTLQKTKTELSNDASNALPSSSVIMPVAGFNNITPLISANQPMGAQNPQSYNLEQSAPIKSELSITRAALESVREANASLTEQLHLLQKQNNQLHAELSQRDREIKGLHEQVKQISAHSQNLIQYWPLFLLLLSAGGLATFAYRYVSTGQRRQEDTEVAMRITPTTSNEANTAFINPQQHIISHAEKSSAMGTDLIVAEELYATEQFKAGESVEHKEKKPTEDDVLVPVKQTDEFIEPNTQKKGVDSSSRQEDKNEDYLEFESGLYHSLVPEIDSVQISESQVEATDDGIDFVLEPVQEQTSKEQEEQHLDVDAVLKRFFAQENSDSDSTKTSSEDLSELLKSKTALDTLLALAKTYISMADMASARHSLNEVLEHGTAQQQEEAARLLDLIKSKY